MPIKLSPSILLSLLLLPYNVAGQQNNSPVIRITSPLANSSQPLNTLIRYSITISDKEDGESIYGEINGSEVYLSVRYWQDTVVANAGLAMASKPDPAGLVLLQKSNCVNCHNFNSTLIGPSFAEIAKRYPNTKSNEANLVKHVLDGSSGIWGSTDMPGHPELSADDAQKIIAWVLLNAGDGRTKFHVGMAGTLRLVVPVADRPGGVFMLRASYTDHGLGNKPKNQSSTAILIQSK